MKMPSITNNGINVTVNCLYLPLVVITRLIIKTPDMIVKSIAGLYWRMDGYSSTIDAPNVSMHPMTVPMDAGLRKKRK